MSKHINILIVEDNPDDAELLVLELERGGFNVDFERVDTPESFSKALTQQHWDLIFSDHSMPRFSSLHALNLRNQSGLDIPFIILSGTMGEDMAVEAMRSGASDYFVKGGFTRLVSAVNRELQEAQQRAYGRQSEWELEHFVASLTHDLRTPILAESRILELLAQGTFDPLTDAQAEVINELVRSNQFVQHMVQNILFTYKYRQRQVILNKEQTNLLQFVQMIVESLTIRTILQEKNVQLRIEESVTELPPIYFDRHEVQRVLLNLIKNAVEYSPPRSEVSVALTTEEDRVCVTVQDFGPGVDSTLEPYLFTMYAPATVKKYRKLGLGLGLYLSKQIIMAHGGHIGYVRSNDGSRFYFFLPMGQECSLN